MLFFASNAPRALSSFRLRICLLLAVLAGLLTPQALLAEGPEAEVRPATPARLLSPIDEHALVTLRGHVRADLTPDKDLGAVDDGMPLRLSLVVQRSAAQQADLDNLLARQQQPTAAEYHKWLTPKAFGARFGAAPDDLAKLSGWLESHGLRVRGVLNNSSIIDFDATAGQVRETFHTEIHNFNVQGGKYAANTQDPKIPAALAPVVASIFGLSKIPPMAHHTKTHQAAYDAEAHRWHDVQPDGALVRPEFNAGSGYYLVSPQDLYTIYNINQVFTGDAGPNLGSKSVVAVVEESDIQYGTVDPTTRAATGGDVATFRTVFGVPGTLNMHVYHGFGTVTCSAPGVDPYGVGEDEEASLDAEWANATAPSANLIFMSCDQSPDNGIWTSLEALVDNSLADVMSLSYGSSELNYGSAGSYAFQDTLYAQAASQGQSIFISAGDSGSDTADQNTTGTATSGINVSGFLSPLVTATGGTDFSDLYDQLEGGPLQSAYWGNANSAHYEDALSYVPETAWNNSCVGSLYATVEGLPGLGLCTTQGIGSADGSIEGGGGGISTHYAVPSYQLGISGYSGASRSIPDIAGFAANGWWGSYLLYCDSNPSYSGAYNCSTSSNFGGAGGTSFVAPYMAGVAGLLVNASLERWGVLNPYLYALAKTQYTEYPTACYSNGQASNAGVTTGLPASYCIFNDVTTGNNDEPCAPGATACYSGTGSVGALSLGGSKSLSIAYPSAPGFDQVTGIGSVNVANLLLMWGQADTSTIGISASATSISTTQSTTLNAAVTGGVPGGYVGTPAAVTGTVNFVAGTTALGSCTVSAGRCSLTVPGSAFATGPNSVSGTFVGSSAYPSSTSSILTVTVTAGGTPAVLTSPTPGSTLTSSSATFQWTAGTGVTQYVLGIGSTGVGSYNLYNSTPITATQASVTGLPTNGETLYARLYSLISGTWQYHDYTYTAAATPAVLTSPTPGSTLTSSSATFQWTAGTGVTQYVLGIGSTGLGSYNLYNSTPITATQASVTGLPTNGTTLYARLYSMINGAWQYNDYTYIAAATPAVLTSPTPGTALTSSSATFQWTAGTGVTQYVLGIGSTGVGSYNLYNSTPITATQASVTGLPTNGETLYARLYSLINGAWQYHDYTYTAVATPAVLTSPTPSSTLTSSSVTFQWTAGSGVTQYVLGIGSTGVGSYNLFNSTPITATQVSVTGLPTNGEKLYARLYSLINGAWQYNDYTYTAQ